MANRYIPINKGHFYDLEPFERQEAFEAKLSMGWEAEYKEYRRLWTELPRTRTVRDYPLLVDLETTSRCNLKCPMCPTVTAEFKEKRMSADELRELKYEYVEKVVSEVADKVYSLRLSWIGEPTLYRRLIDAVKLAKNSGIKEVSFLTNGSRMNMDYFKALVDAGVDLITWSVDGMGAMYEKVRYPLKYDETLRKLKDISSFKKAEGIEKPLIKIQGVWPAIKNCPEEFYNTFSPLVDLIAFNPLIDYLHNDADIVYEDGFSCPQHYQRVVIGSNGKAVMCSSDDFMDIVIGDISKQSIQEIWLGDDFQRLRNLHQVRDGYLSLKPCKNCFYPRKMSFDEAIMINGRVVAVQSYVNRNQEIGK